MPRSAIRELVRRAQRAELDGDVSQAVQILEEAAERAIELADAGRAASLLRHCLRMAPSRADLAERLEWLPKEAVAPRQVLDLPPRGPAPADPAVDAWCSFCCRPKAEVGPLVAGPAGAFICAPCVRVAAQIAAGAQSPVPAETPPALPSCVAAPPDFIEAAVQLSRELSWSLQEIRSLSDEERRRALEVLRSQRGAER